MKFTYITGKKVLSFSQLSISLPQLNIDGPYFHTKSRNKKITHLMKNKVMIQTKFEKKIDTGRSKLGQSLSIIGASLLMRTAQKFNPTSC